jgi:hypothetical protein
VSTTSTRGAVTSTVPRVARWRRSAAGDGDDGGTEARIAAITPAMSIGVQERGILVAELHDARTPGDALEAAAGAFREPTSPGRMLGSKVTIASGCASRSAARRRRRGRGRSRASPCG